MSRFSRAYDGALKAAGLQQADAAAIAGWHTSMISRLLNGRSALAPKHVRQLLLAIQDQADREHCLREFLFDCCPEEYRDRLIISLGAAHEARAIGRDDISTDLAVLERLAEQNPDLRELFDILVRLLTQAEPRGAGADDCRAVTDLLAGARRKPAPTPRTKK